MLTVIITIGRNIPAGQHAQDVLPLPETAWEDFKAQVFSLATTAGGQVVSMSSGLGIWEGTKEETHVIIALFGATPSNIPALRDALASTGAKYGQDAIGFISVPSSQTLIEC